MIVPVIILAVGLYFAFAPLGLTNTYLGLILAHTALAAPFVVITVLATLPGFDRNLIARRVEPGRRAGDGVPPRDAAADRARRRLGRLFAFAVSFDEVVVVLFIGGPGQRTLPRQMFSGIRENISLTITAAATLLIVVSVLLMACVELLRRRSERLAGHRV